MGVERVEQLVLDEEPPCDRQTCQDAGEFAIAGLGPARLEGGVFNAPRKYF
jgi:hypothetical protein